MPIKTGDEFESPLPSSPEGWRTFLMESSSAKLVANVRMKDKALLPLETQEEYIGRPSPFGNPFVLPPGSGDAERLACVEKYRVWVFQKFKTNPEYRKSIEALRGRRLLCFCAPKYCHGHVLAWLANQEWKKVEPDSRPEVLREYNPWEY